MTSSPLPSSEASLFLKSILDIFVLNFVLRLLIMDIFVEDLFIIVLLKLDGIPKSQVRKLNPKVVVELGQILFLLF